MNKSFDPQMEAEFDRYANDYEAMHEASVAASGEGPQYFAIYKQRVLDRMFGDELRRTGAPLLDFGCGIGNLTEHLVQSFPVVHGYDPSSRCIELGKKRAPSATFHHELEAVPKNHFAVVVLANVLHHVTPSERSALVDEVAQRLIPGGHLVVFEHNPLNPVTRHAVKICPFDEGVELLWPWELTRLLSSRGLTDVRRDFIVFFPRALATLRPIEPNLAWLPLGAQVCVSATAPLHVKPVPNAES